MREQNEYERGRSDERDSLLAWFRELLEENGREFPGQHDVFIDAVNDDLDDLAVLHGIHQD